MPPLSLAVPVRALTTYFPECGSGQSQPNPWRGPATRPALCLGSRHRKGPADRAFPMAELALIEFSIAAAVTLGNLLRD